MGRRDPALTDLWTGRRPGCTGSSGTRMPPSCGRFSEPHPEVGSSTGTACGEMDRRGRWRFHGKVAGCGDTGQQGDRQRDLGRWGQPGTTHYRAGWHPHPEAPALGPRLTSWSQTRRSLCGPGSAHSHRSPRGGYRRRKRMLSVLQKSRVYGMVPQGHNQRDGRALPRQRPAWLRATQECLRAILPHSA